MIQIFFVSYIYGFVYRIDKFRIQTHISYNKFYHFEQYFPVQSKKKNLFIINLLT